MFVTLGFGSQIPLSRAIFHGLGTQTPGVETLRVERNSLTRPVEARHQKICAARFLQRVLWQVKGTEF